MLLVTSSLGTGDAGDLLVLIALTMDCSSGTIEANLSIVPGMWGFRLCRCARSASCESRMREADMSVPVILFKQTRSRTRTELEAKAYQMSHQVMASNLPIASSLSSMRANARPESEHDSAIAVRAVFLESVPSLDKMLARVSRAERHKTITV